MEEASQGGGRDAASARSLFPHQHLTTASRFPSSAQTSSRLEGQVALNLINNHEHTTVASPLRLRLRLLLLLLYTPPPPCVIPSTPRRAS